MSPRRIALLLFLALAASSFVDRVQSRRLISLPGGAAPRLRDNHHSTAAIAAAPSDTATVAAAAAPSDTATVAAAAAFDATSTGSGRAAAASAAPTTLIAAAAAHTAGTSSSTPSAGSARAAAASATSANAIAAAGSHTISMNGSTTGAGSGSNLGTTTIGSSKCRWCWWRGWKGSSAKKSAGGSTRGFMRPYSGKVPSYAAKSVSFKGGPCDVAAIRGVPHLSRHVARLAEDPNYEFRRLHFRGDAGQQARQRQGLVEHQLPLQVGRHLRHAHRLPQQHRD
ncbi:hypothetical protein CLOM_g3097 [Closterium sp. NIES-68]|nr:hypothetical protein CLOM_g3097 [Closterium sp. NIES-68]